MSEADASQHELATQGLRALHYVQDEIRYLSAIELTHKGRHALLIFRLMLREIWKKEYRDGEFIFLEDTP